MNNIDNSNTSSSIQVSMDDMNNSKDVLSAPVTSSVVLTGKAKRLANLRPAKKGEVRNPTGKRGPLIKPAVDKLLTKERIERIAEKIVSNAESGIETKVDTLLKLTGDFNEESKAPTTINNTIIGDDVLSSAIEYLKQKQITDI